MKAPLLRSLITERVTGTSGPAGGWTVGRCSGCQEPVWLSDAWVDLLAGDPEAGASCFECAHALVEPAR